MSEVMKSVKKLPIYDAVSRVLPDEYTQDVGALPFRCYARTLQDATNTETGLVLYNKAPYTSGFVAPSTSSPLTAVVSEDPNKRPGVVSVTVSDNLGDLAYIPVASDGMKQYILKKDDTLGDPVVINENELIILGITFMSDILPIIDEYKKSLAEASRQSSVSHSLELSSITQTIIYDPPILTMRTYVSNLVGCKACGGHKLTTSGITLPTAVRKRTRPSSEASTSSQIQESIGVRVLPILAAGAAGAVLGGALARGAYPYSYPYGYSYGYPYSVYDPYYYPRPLIVPHRHRFGRHGRRW
jgi:hypothetical protein